MNTKRLELFLLAGCSCLITVLAQPITSAMSMTHAKSVPASPAKVPSLQAPKPSPGAYCPADFKRMKATPEIK